MNEGRDACSYQSSRAASTVSGDGPSSLLPNIFHAGRTSSVPVSKRHRKMAEDRRSVYIWRGGHVRNCVRQGSQISAHVGTNPTAVIVFMDRPCVRYSGHSIPARSEPNSPPGKHCGAGEQEANDSKEQF